MIRALVTDLNGSFAAMEQHHNPELRGRPVAVVPVMADTSMVIASSREAKQGWGIKCGTGVAEAKQICPDIHIMQATPGLYVSYQKRMRELMESVIHIYDEPSIDEFRFRLMGEERHPDRAREIAMRMKRLLREEFSPCITMSAGIAPNFFLAKVATEMDKYDGLTILNDEDLPHALHVFPSLTKIVGINWRMKVRLNAEGIFSVEELTSASKQKLQKVWGTVVGERWYRWLQGEDVPEVRTRPSSLGHSHVLPRELRNRAGVKAITLRLLGKLTARLRSKGYWTSAMGIRVSGRESWEYHRRIPETQDDRDLIPLVSEWLDRADYSWPLKVSIAFWDFRTQETFTPSLFCHDPEWGRPEPVQPPHEPSRFGSSLDYSNSEYGKHKIYLAAIHEVRQNGVEKIAFQKRELFREGRDDVLPTWDRRPHLSPAEALLCAVEQGEALVDLVEHRRTAPPPDPSLEIPAWEPVEERSFLLIADRVRETLADREHRLHRGELRRLVARLLRIAGYDSDQTAIATEVVFHLVDAGPLPSDPPHDPFPDEDSSEAEGPEAEEKASRPRVRKSHPTEVKADRADREQRLLALTST